jgi:hypothetical protein
MSDQLNLDYSQPTGATPEPNLIEKAKNFLTKRYGKAFEPGGEFGPLTEEKRAEYASLPPVQRLGKRVSDAAKNTLENFLAEKYNIVNELSFGAPNAVIKAIDRATKGDAYKKLQELKGRHQVAADYGTLGGLVSGIAIPGGSYLGGASKAAKAAGLGKAASVLGKGAEIASGAKKLGEGAGLLGRVGGAIGKGALLGAEQAVPRGLFTAIGEGDVGKGLKEAGTGVALGGALGGAGQLLGEGLKGLGGLASKYAQSKGLMRKSGDVIEPLRKSLTNAELVSTFPDLKASDFKRAATEYARKIGVNKTGYIINAADDMKEAALDLSKQYGLRNLDDLKEFIQGTGKVFEQAYDKAAAAGATPVSILAPALQEGGEIAAFAASHGDEGTKVVSDLVSKLEKAPDLRTAKAILDRQAAFYRSPAAASLGQAAFDAPDLVYALKDKIDDAVMSVDPALAQAKDSWRKIGPLRQLVARDELGLGGMMAGSPTMEKKGLAKLFETASSGGGAGIGMALGGVPGLVAGSAAGQALSKGVPAVTNFLKGELAGKLNNPKTLEAIGKGVEMARSLAGRVGKIAPKVAELAPRAAGALAGRGLEAAETETVTPEAEEAKVSAQAAESQVAPEQAEEAKQEVNSKWADRVTSGIQDAYYAYGLKDAGWSYDDFVSAVQSATDNFDPKLSADIVFSDDKERAAFLKDYERALQYKAIDVTQALEPQGFLPSGGQQSSRAALEDYVARIAGQDPIMMDPKKRKAIGATIKRISKMGGSMAQKQSALLRELQANYGVDFQRLADLGLIGVV